MAKTIFGYLKGNRHGKDGLAALYGDHASGGKTFAVSNSIHFVQNGHASVACAQEIAVEAMSASIFRDCSRGSYQCLTDHLSTIYALPALVGAGR